MPFKKKHESLLANQVHLWCLNFRKHLNHIPYYESLLSDEEQTKASKFRFKKDRNQSIISRGALRILSAHYLKIQAKDITFKYGTHGKPTYNFKSDLSFNISHSGDMAVIGFVKHYDIGVDIEKIKNDFDVLDIAVNYFSEKEILELKTLPKEALTEGFYKCWTRKESFIKATSQGLSFPLDAFSVSIQPKTVSLLETKWNKEEARAWNLFSFSPAENYVGAIAVKGPIKTMNYFEFNA